MSTVIMAYMDSYTQAYLDLKGIYLLFVFLPVIQIEY